MPGKGPGHWIWTPGSVMASPTDFQGEFTQAHFNRRVPQFPPCKVGCCPGAGRLKSRPDCACSHLTLRTAANGPGAVKTGPGPCANYIERQHLRGGRIWMFSPKESNSGKRLKHIISASQPRVAQLIHRKLPPFLQAAL